MFRFDLYAGITKLRYQQSIRGDLESAVRIAMRFADENPTFSVSLISQSGYRVYERTV